MPFSMNFISFAHYTKRYALEIHVQKLYNKTMYTGTRNNHDEKDASHIGNGYLHNETRFSSSWV